MSGDGPLRLAMWSGPRNLSTALMRSFAQRADCQVWDEPFYAAYLAKSGIEHPMQEEILATGILDPEEVARRCLAPLRPGKSLFYQKQMTHHMLPGFDLGWTAGVTNCFLIRDPLQVAASYEAKREFPELADLGFERQKELFDREAERLGKAPPVLDATRLAAQPEASLRALCAAVGIPFDPAMLRWPAGPQPEDGVWGQHWYGAIWRSTGFLAPRQETRAASDWAKRLAEAAEPSYRELAEAAL